MRNLNFNTLRKSLQTASASPCRTQVPVSYTHLEVGQKVVMIPNQPPMQSDEEFYENYMIGTHFLSSGFDGFMREFVSLPKDRVVPYDAIEDTVAAITEFVSVGTVSYTHLDVYKRQIYSHTDLYDFRANIEGAEKIFQLFKPLLEKSDANLVKELEADFKSVNSLLDKHMTDKEHYKLYTDLTKEDTKELSEAVTKLGEPLSQMGKFLSGE